MWSNFFWLLASIELCEVGTAAAFFPSQATGSGSWIPNGPRSPSHHILPVSLNTFPHKEKEDDNYDYEEESSAASRRVRRPRSFRPSGPGRRFRATKAAREELERRQTHSYRQRLAHQDPTLLAAQTYTDLCRGSRSSDSIHDEGLLLHTDLHRALVQSLGVDQMTRVQAACYGHVLEGNSSLWVRSKTGTGKTLAYLVPLIHRTLFAEDSSNAELRASRGIRILVVAPTRELVQQIGTVARNLLLYHPSNTKRSLHGNRPPSSSLVQVVVGGTSLMHSIRQLEQQPPTILIATPGRLVEMLEMRRKYRRPFLTQVETCVWDEGDHIAQSFAPEAQAIVRKLGHSVQTLVFSATWGSSKKREKGPASATRYLFKSKDNGFVTIDCVEDLNFKIDKSVNEPVTNFLREETGRVNVNVHEYASQLATMDEYLPTLLNLMAVATPLEHEDGELPKIVVFFPTTKIVQLVAHICKSAVKLPQSPKLLPVIGGLHSRMSRSARQKVSQAFAQAKTGVLLTSDVSARGMDYANVTWVVQYGAPSNRELYLHRLGRTGRAGSVGRGLVVLMPWEQAQRLETRSRSGRSGLEKLELSMHLKSGTESSLSSVFVEEGWASKNSRNTELTEAAYKSFVAYYTGTGNDSTTILDAGQQLTRSMGLPEAPPLTGSLAESLG